VYRPTPVNTLRPFASRHLWRWAATIALAGVALVSLWYLVEQGFHFVSHQLRARSNHEIAVRNPEFAAFLGEVDAIRSFGTEHLGLRATGSYTRFVRTDKDHVVVVVSAVRPDSFERKVWRFPIVGRVPYLGFYREAAALREAERLKAQGWETFTRRVGAFSSLGYFTDPLYSYMAGYHPERLASMVLHEMTHATIWFANDVALNEAIATFVGYAGALAYLEHRYGPHSPELAEALRRQTERDTYNLFMRNLASRLDELYRSGLPFADVMLGKQTIFAEETEHFRANHALWFADGGYQGFLQGNVNNAYVDLFRTYNTDVDLIAAFHAAGGEDLADLIARAAGLLTQPAPRLTIADTVQAFHDDASGVVDEHAAPGS
jgi:predicted aminopeptidase